MGFDKKKSLNLNDIFKLHNNLKYIIRVSCHYEYKSNMNWKK